MVRREDCIEWKNARSKAGYGQKWNPEVRRLEYVHRVEWAKHNGPIPDGMYVLHKCDNPSCYNIEHLFLGNDKDNAVDREKKGRGNQPIGLKNGKCKFSDEDVRMMRELYSQGKSQTWIASWLNCNSSTVSRIVRGIYRSSVGKSFDAAANSDS